MPGDKINFLTNGRGNPSPTMLGFDGAWATNARPYDRWKRLPRKAPSRRGALGHKDTLSINLSDSTVLLFLLSKVAQKKKKQKENAVKERR